MENINFFTAMKVSGGYALAIEIAMCWLSG